MINAPQPCPVELNQSGKTYVGSYLIHDGVLRVSYGTASKEVPVSEMPNEAVAKVLMKAILLEGPDD
jgi:hypothetical protein